MNVYQPIFKDTVSSLKEGKKPTAIVIGAGFGGLAAAIRLGARGYKVTILDRLDDVGGRACVIRSNGFTFDAGPTLITAPFVFEELFELCGEKLEDHITLEPLNPFYKIHFNDGQEFNCYASEEQMYKEIARFNPRDVKGYKAFLKESELCYETGFEKMIDTPFHQLWTMVKSLPGLALRRADRSIHNLAKKYIKNENLQKALSFHPLFIGGNPIKTTGVMSLVSYLERRFGVHYTVGGTGALATAFAGLIKKQGGTIKQNCTVDEILVENNTIAGVKLETGEVIKANIVVSNADTGFTYKHLLRNHKRKRWTDRRLNKSKYSMSLFVWYFGTNRQYKGIDHHTILMGPRYEGLLKDIFDKNKLADDFSLYLYHPSATDKSVAPDGCSTFYVLSPVPNLDCKIDWKNKAEAYRQSIQDFLERKIMPDLSKHIVESHIRTPDDFKNTLLSTKGAAFGMQPLITQLAWFRPHNKSEEVKNLFIVGAGTHPGAGVPTVVTSAKILDKVVPHASTFI